MVRMHVLTQLSQPLLWVWRDQAADVHSVLAEESLHIGRARTDVNSSRRSSITKSTRQRICSFTL